MWDLPFSFFLNMENKQQKTKVDAFDCCDFRNEAHMASHWHKLLEEISWILMIFKDYKLLNVLLSKEEPVSSPCMALCLPSLLLFDNCSLRQSRSSFWFVLSVFSSPPSWLHLAFLTILILIVCCLVTLWCTWLWCGLRDGGNYHRVGGGMPLSLHLLHGDKPHPRVQQGNSILQPPL